MKRLYLLSLFWLVCWSGYSQEYKLHPVYIYSFTKYVVWPDAYRTGDFEILVLGESSIIKELTNMSNLKKTPDNRVIKVSKIESPTEIRKCNIVFVPAGKSNLISDVLTKVGAEPILIITEEAGLGAKGSNINFIIKDGKLAFELNQGSMSKQNLKATSELSRLAIMI